MAVNLAKHKEALTAAWKDVLDDKTSTNWSLFGYEGQTNDLKVISTGDGGIEEMADDLNSGKIMYAFCKVFDPKTSLPKCVLIIWQGEGAPLVRKGTCVNHVRDISNFFKGAHLTITARTEEEVDYQLIIEKVSKATGSAYSFKERGEHIPDSQPIGTSYKRVIPRQEINTKERDQFWEKEEEEEKKRQEQERKRKEEEKQKLENELRERELAEAALREERINEKSKNISVIREAEYTANDNYKRLNEVPEMVDDPQQEERERTGRTDALRRQRSQEAQALISKRTIDARAVFEQNTSAGQLHNLRRSSHPVQSSTEITENTSVNKVYSIQSDQGAYAESDKNASTYQQDPGIDKFTVDTSSVMGNNQEKSDVSGLSVGNNSAAPGSWNDDLSEINNLVASSENDDQDDDCLLFEGDQGLRARALYDYQAADITEITFDPGDIITHIDQIDEGWWQGVGPDGTFGLFPANYVELIN